MLAEVLLAFTSCAYAYDLCGVQHVHYVDEMKDVLADLGTKLHVMSGTNTDSGRAVTPPAFEGIADFKVETDTLFDVLTECRVVRLWCHVDDSRKRQCWHMR